MTRKLSAHSVHNSFCPIYLLLLLPLFCDNRLLLMTNVIVGAFYLPDNFYADGTDVGKCHQFGRGGGGRGVANNHCSLWHLNAGIKSSEFRFCLGTLCLHNNVPVAAVFAGTAYKRSFCGGNWIADWNPVEVLWPRKTTCRSKIVKL